MVYQSVEAGVVANDMECYVLFGDLMKSAEMKCQMEI